MSEYTESLYDEVREAYEEALSCREELDGLIEEKVYEINDLVGEVNDRLSRFEDHLRECVAASRKTLDEQPEEVKSSEEGAGADQAIDEAYSVLYDCGELDEVYATGPDGLDELCLPDFRQVRTSLEAMRVALAEVAEVAEALEVAEEEAS